MWWAAVIAALAAAGKAYQDNQVAKRQDNEMVAALREQQEAEQRARARIQQDLTHYDQNAAAKVKTAEQGDYLSQVQKALPGGAGPYRADSSLAASVQRQNERAQENAGANTNLADLFGTIGAAGTQRQNEAISTAQTGSYLNQLAGSANRSFNAHKAIASSIHANPWLRMVLDAAQAYGMSSAAAGAAGGGNMASAAQGGAGYGIGGAGNAGMYAGYV